MRTWVIIGLVVGPVVVFGAPLVLASGVTLRPEWSTAVFLLAGVVALLGLLLLALSFRRRPVGAPAAPVAAPAAPVVAPVDDPAPTAPPLAPLHVVHNARPGRYVTAPAAPVEEPDPITEPAPGLVTLRPRDGARSPRQTVGAR